MFALMLKVSLHQHKQMLGIMCQRSLIQTREVHDLFEAAFALRFPAAFGSARKVFPKLLKRSQDTLGRHTNPVPVIVSVCVEPPRD